MTAERWRMSSSPTTSVIPSETTKRWSVSNDKVLEFKRTVKPPIVRRKKTQGTAECN